MLPLRGMIALRRALTRSLIVWMNVNTTSCQVHSSIYSLQPHGGIQYSVPHKNCLEPLKIYGIPFHVELLSFALQNTNFGCRCIDNHTGSWYKYLGDFALHEFYTIELDIQFHITYNGVLRVLVRVNARDIDNIVAIECVGTTPLVDLPGIVLGVPLLAKQYYQCSTYNQHSSTSK